MTLQPGTFLKSQYRIDALIGGGGMAMVYRAFDFHLQRVCAIKQNMYTAAAAQQQFQLEAVTLASLHHAHLVGVLDHFSDMLGQQYLVMEFVAGENLDSHIKRVGPISERQALVWMAGVLDAVHLCHSKGVIHRDIKPANLVRRQDQDSVVLVDFGIAKQMAGGVTPAGARAASPAYAPPEQLLGSRTDVRTDVYALGATLYFLLTGQEPASPLQVMAGTQRLMSPRAINPRISPTTEKAILRAMSQDMRDRPADVTDFARLLQAPAGGPVNWRIVRWITAALVLLALLVSVMLAAPRLIEWVERAALTAPTPIALVVSSSTTPTLQPAAISATSTSPVESSVVVPVSPTLELPVDLGGASVTFTQPAPAAVNTPMSQATAPGSPRGPTSTPAPQATLPSQLVAQVTPASAASDASSDPTLVVTPLLQPTAVATPCPPYLRRPLPGMGLLLIENHLGEPLHIDNIATGEKWDMAPKQGELPARLLLDLRPGQHTFVDNTPHGHGRIGVTITAGSAFISPIWYNNRTEELVYPLDIPDGCQ